jgi:hypothetical protein
VLETEYVCDSSQLPYCDTSCYIAQVNRLKQRTGTSSGSSKPSSPSSSGKLALMEQSPSSSSLSSSAKLRVRTPKSSSPSPSPVSSPAPDASPASEQPVRVDSPPASALDAFSPRSKQRLKVKQRRAVTAPIATIGPLPGGGGGGGGGGAAVPVAAVPAADSYGVVREVCSDSHRDCEQCKSSKAAFRLVISNNAIRVSVYLCSPCADRVEANNGKLEPVSKGSPSSPGGSKAIVGAHSAPSAPGSLLEKKAKRQEAKATKKQRRDKPAGKATPNGNRTFDASELKALYADARRESVPAAAESAGKAAALTTDDLRPKARASLSHANLNSGGAVSAATAGAAAAAATATAPYEIREDTFITDLDQMALAAIRKRQAALASDASHAPAAAAATTTSTLAKAPVPKVSAAERVFFAQLLRTWNEQSPKKAIAELTASKFDSSARGIATFLLVEHEALDKVSLGEMLGREDALWRDVLREYLHRLSLSQRDLLYALRTVIAQFRLPGEGQVINRIMETFSQVYCSLNKGFFKDPDNVHTLAMLVLTLNTATHNPNEQRKISIENWIAYCEELSAAERRCTPAYLEAIWHSIQDQEIRMPMEGMFPDMVRRGFLEFGEGTFRSWKSRWFVLSDSCLYIFDTPEDEDPRTIVPLHDIVARVWPKRANTLELASADAVMPLVYTEKTSNQGKLKQGKQKTLLFAALTEKERDIWIDEINANQFVGRTAVPLSALLDDADDDGSSVNANAAAPSFAAPTPVVGDDERHGQRRSHKKKSKQK